MTRHYTEYNDTIKLRHRDIGEIVEKAKQSGCRYYMQLNLQGRSIWVGFNEAFEAGIDRLYAMYYKLPIEDGVINICLGLWRSSPSPHHILAHLLQGVSNIPDPIVTPDLVHRFLGKWETSHIALKRPTYVSERKMFSDILPLPSRPPIFDR